MIRLLSFITHPRILLYPSARIHDCSVFKKLPQKRKKSKSLSSHDENSDAVAAVPLRKSQGTSDTFPNLSTSSLPLDNKYDKHCQGPFDVFIQPESGGSTSIDPLFVDRLLSSTIRKDISKIKKVDYSKLLVQFNSCEAANNLINNPILKSKNLIAYIPSFRTSRQGIIRNVPLDLSVDDIKSGLVSSFEVASVRRLNRKILSEDSSSSFIPSKSVSISFKDQRLPNYIYLYMVRYELSPFISKTIQCFSCFHFGHSKFQCKGYSRCIHWGEVLWSNYLS